MAWMNGMLTVDAFGLMGMGHATISYTLPYRNVIPEPATALLVGVGLALPLRQGRSRAKMLPRT